MVYPVISLRQPWAGLVVNGIKDAENRDWRLPDKYHNCTVLVHASAKPMFSVREAIHEIAIRELPAQESFSINTTLSGFIIGAVRFKGCVPANLNPASPWCDAGSDFWWMIENATPLPPVPARGKLRFWKFDYPGRVEWPVEVV